MTQPQTQLLPSINHNTLQNTTVVSDTQHTPFDSTTASSRTHATYVVCTQGDAANVQPARLACELVVDQGLGLHGHGHGRRRRRGVRDDSPLWWINGSESAVVDKWICAHLAPLCRYGKRGMRRVGVN